MRQVRTISRKDSEQVLDVTSVPESVGFYLAGFADGEGSFNVSFRPRADYRQPWKISLCFNISQRDPLVLRMNREYLGCGTMRQRADGVWYYEVNALRDLVANVIPFFERFAFRSDKKRRDFRKFRELARIMSEGRHLTYDGVRQILEIRRDMNDGGKRRYQDDEILTRFQFGESSETVCRTPDLREMRQSELHGDMQSGYRTPPSSDGAQHKNGPKVAKFLVG